jgi:hypothetical protein
MDTKEMSVEEAIEVLELLQNNFFCRIGITTKDKLNDIISLLQDLSTAQEEGEKWKAIVEYLKSHCGYAYYGSSDNVATIIERLEQKYFPEPQPVKKTVTIEVEGEDIDTIKWIKSEIKELENVWNKGAKCNIKINIKEDLNAD